MRRLVLAGATLALLALVAWLLLRSADRPQEPPPLEAALAFIDPAACDLAAHSAGEPA